jgi:hypothetical protein
MDDKMKKAHLNYEHKGKEEAFAKDGCILCKNFLDGKDLIGAGEDLAVDIREDAPIGEAIN